LRGEKIFAVRVGLNLQKFWTKKRVLWPKERARVIGQLIGPLVCAEIGVDQKIDGKGEARLIVDGHHRKALPRQAVAVTFLKCVAVADAGPRAERLSGSHHRSQILIAAGSGA